ncbi:unannotated protein [freshwater metagenome]|uniref:Unannotated protein n=1 Tax=freshwater metagenome TaxID=449393 RepID=A0A6J7UPZ3_9ZZZZ
MLSYHAFNSGSVTASSISWAMTLTIASAPASAFGDTFWAPHTSRFGPVGSPTNAYLMLCAPILRNECHPQYWVRKPGLPTSLLVSTR